MNMLLTESAPLISHVPRLLKPKGRLIWTGILAEEYQGNHCPGKTAWAAYHHTKKRKRVVVRDI